MTKKELLEKMAPFPDDMDIMIYQNSDEYGYVSAETVEVREVNFSAPEIPKKEWAKIPCIIISDEI